MTRTKRLTTLLLVTALFSISATLLGNSPAKAAPSSGPLAAKLASVQSGVLAAGKYSYILAFSDNAANADSMQDPTDGASFNAGVDNVYAWVAIKRNDASAPATDFPVDIKFTSPNGLAVKSSYVGNKQTITPGNQQYDKGSLVGKSIPIKGNANATALGTWSVSFEVGGQNLTTESFTLIKAGAATTSGTPVSQTTPEAASTPTSGDTSACEQSAATADPASQVQNCLLGLGYDVQDTGQATLKDGKTKIAYVFSTMADPQRNFYSSDTAMQIFYSFAVLANAWPDSDGLAVELSYSPQYTIIAATTMTDWTAFTNNVDMNDPSKASQAWTNFSKNLNISIYDEQNQQVLSPQETNDFTNKNFGGSSNTGGNDPTAPIGNPNRPANSNVARVSISADTISLPPDGKSTSLISVKVYDRQSKVLANEEVSFTLSGGGKLKPVSTSTDSKGMAQTTYTAGSKTGQVTIVATAGGVRGAASINLSTSDVPQSNTGDPSDAVNSTLTTAGYEVTSAGLLKDNQTAYVLMPRVSATLDDNLLKQIITGWGALYDAYPKNDYLVITSFAVQGTNYAVLWFISNADLNKVVTDLNEGSEASKTDANTILNKALSSFSVVNLDTGEAISDSKSFMNKNFGGG